MFLRPVAMRDAAGASALARNRDHAIRASQQQVRKDAPETLPGEAGVALPRPR